MPSIRSRPEGPKYGKKNFLWILQAASSSYELPARPPLPNMLQHLPRFLLLPWKKSYVTLNFFVLLLFYYLKTSNKLIVKKR